MPSAAPGHGRGEAMTPEEVTACQVKLDRVMSQFNHLGLVGKVREHAGWTDEETGEWNPGEWVAEVRYVGVDPMRVLTLDLGHWREAAADEVWTREIEELVRCRS